MPRNAQKRDSHPASYCSRYNDRTVAAICKRGTEEMTTDTIRERLDREPFEPFRIVTSAGEHYTIHDPHTVALMKSEVFVAHPKSDRRTFIPLLHVATVETLPNGSSTRRRKPKG